MINQIILGDCLEVMKEIPDQSVDMVLADLPYGLKGLNNKTWNTPIDLVLFWIQVKRIIKPKTPVVLTATQPFTTDLVNSNRKWFRYEWIWEKTAPSNILNAKIQPLRYHENILVFCQKTSNYYPIREPRSAIGINRLKTNGRIKDGIIKGSHYNNEKIGYREYDPFTVNPRSVQKFNSVPNCNGAKLHPTQKPVALFEYLIKTYTNEGDLVLDPTIGSGTTAIAALNTNRRFIGIEKDPEYHQKACDRIESWYQQNIKSELVSQ